LPAAKPLLRGHWDELRSSPLFSMNGAHYSGVATGLIVSQMEPRGGSWIAEALQEIHDRRMDLPHSGHLGAAAAVLKILEGKSDNADR
jgi:hypothetical protein